MSTLLANCAFLWVDLLVHSFSYAASEEPHKRLYCQWIISEWTADSYVTMSVVTYLLLAVLLHAVLLFSVLFYFSRALRVRLTVSKTEPLDIVEAELFLLAGCAASCHQTQPTTRAHSVHFNTALCGLRGFKNGPAPFPGRMSYKATKPGLVCLSYLSMLYYCIVVY